MAWPLKPPTPSWPKPPLGSLGTALGDARGTHPWISTFGVSHHAGGSWGHGGTGPWGAGQGAGWGPSCGLANKDPGKTVFFVLWDGRSLLGRGWCLPGTTSWLSQTVPDTQGERSGFSSPISRGGAQTTPAISAETRNSWCGGVGEGRRHPPSAPLPGSLLWLRMGMSPAVFANATSQAPLHPVRLLPSTERHFTPWPRLTWVLLVWTQALLGERCCTQGSCKQGGKVSPP